TTPATTEIVKPRTKRRPSSPGRTFDVCFEEITRGSAQSGKSRPITTASPEEKNVETGGSENPRCPGEKGGLERGHLCEEPRGYQGGDHERHRPQDHPERLQAGLVGTFQYQRDRQTRDGDGRSGPEQTGEALRPDRLGQERERDHEAAPEQA